MSEYEGEVATVKTDIISFEEKRKEFTSNSELNQITSLLKTLEL